MADAQFPALDALATWMRANGVRRAHLRYGEPLGQAGDAPLDEAELEFWSPNASVGGAPRAPKTDEERRAAALEERRARYAKELGFAPSDAELEKLP